MFKAAHLVDSQLALIMVNTTVNLLFVVLIMRDIFREIPTELDEAARVEGYSSFGIFYKVALPLAGSGLVAVIPPVVLALLVQRFIVRGLTFGALKG